MVNLSPDRKSYPHTVRRTRLITWLFERAGVAVKPNCIQCGQPFLVERPTHTPDVYTRCPGCQPRPDQAPNAGALCVCGEPAVVIIYTSIHHPDSSHPARVAMPLCYLCAVDELLARLKGQL